MGPFGASEASSWLDLDRSSTQRLLAYLASRGWLVRVRRGLYIPAPLEARQSGQWMEDPWIVAHRLFAPCFIAGWSACEHWGLTEQLFRRLVVVSARRVRHRDIDIQGTPYKIKVVPPEQHFGTVSIWRGQIPVQVSDPSRTVIDLLNDASLGGGMRFTAEVMYEYFHSDHRDDALLVAYAERMGNGTIFKRLGYIIEKLGIDAPRVVQASKQHLTEGVSKLDSLGAENGSVDRRWRLRINSSIGEGGT